VAVHPDEPDAHQASSDERDRAIELIKAAFTAGKISKEDLDYRVGRALTMLFGTDLTALTADLRPVPVPVSESLDPGARDALVSGVLCVLWLPLMVLILVSPLAFRSQLYLLMSSWVVMPVSGVVAIASGLRARHRLLRDGGQGLTAALGGVVAGWTGLALFLLTLLVFFTG
jgi:Domain of unknown function (DUF1707)